MLGEIESQPTPARPDTGNALALIREEGIVPAFDMKNLELLDGRFEELITIMTEKGCTEQTIANARSLRVRFITERANAWRPLTIYGKFKEAAESPEIAEEIKEEQVKLLGQDIGEQVFSRGSFSWMSKHSYTGTDILNRWLDDHGMSEFILYVIGYSYYENLEERRAARRLIEQSFGRWAQHQSTDILNANAEHIRLFQLFSPNVDIAKLVELVQRQFATEYLMGFDKTLDEALSHGIEQAHAMLKRHDATPKPDSILRRLGKIVTGGNNSPDPGYQSDPTGEDMKLLNGFFSISRSLTSINLDFKANGDFQNGMFNDFAAASGYREFLNKCTSQRFAARQQVISALGPDAIEDYLEQFESMTTNWSTHRQSRESSDHRTQKQEFNDRATYSERHRKQDFVIDKNRFHHRITVDTESFDQILIENYAAKVTAAVVDASKTLWKQPGDPDIIKDVIHEALSQIASNPESFDFSKLMRRMAGKYHPDKELNRDKKQSATAKFQLFESFWQYIRAKRLQVTYDDGLAVSVYAEDFPLQ